MKAKLLRHLRQKYWETIRIEPDVSIINNKAVTSYFVIQDESGIVDLDCIYTNIKEARAKKKEIVDNEIRAYCALARAKRMLRKIK